MSETTELRDEIATEIRLAMIDYLEGAKLSFRERSEFRLERSLEAADAILALIEKNRVCNEPSTLQGGTE